jgi:hypothetical protein
VTTEEDEGILPGVPPAGEGEPRRRVECAVCGRPLRDATARLWGLGEGCRAKLALRAAPRPPDPGVDQDPLPGL